MKQLVEMVSFTYFDARNVDKLTALVLSGCNFKFDY